MGKLFDLEECSDYFIAWLAYPGRLDSYDPRKGSLYKWLQNALRKSYADFCKEMDPEKTVSVSVSTQPDMTLLPEDIQSGLKERLKIKAKPTGGFRLAWRGDMSSTDRDDLISTFSTESDRKTINRLFQTSYVPQILSGNLLPEISAELNNFGESLGKRGTSSKSRWRQLLRAISLPLRTRFVALHHNVLGPFDEEEMGQFEIEFDLAYNEAKHKLDSRNRDVILDLLGRSKEWGYQVDHRVNKRTLLELFRSRKERIPLDLRVAFVSMHHKILGSLLNQSEVAEFERQFNLSYEETRAKLNISARKKILDTLRRTSRWAKAITDEIEGLIKGKLS